MINAPKKQQKLFIIIFALFSIISCKEDESGLTKVNGKVKIENNSNNHIVGVSKVYLHRQDPSCLGCGAGVIDTFYSNTDGSYSFSFDANKDFGYSVSAWNSSCFENNNSISINKGDKNSIDITLTPITYLKLIIKNISPKNDADYINVTNTYFNGGVYVFLGTKVDTSVIDVIFGNRTNNIIWFTEKNGIKNTYTSSIYCPAFDTTEYLIEY